MGRLSQWTGAVAFAVLLPWADACAAADKPAAATTQEEFDCVIQPKLTIELGTPEEGVIAEVTVDRGDLVAAGEVVARLESELQRLMIELVRLRAESNVETRSSRARLDLRRTEVARMEALHRKDIVAAKSYDEAILEERLAELAVEAADLEHRMAQVELEEARERLDRRMIRSPVDGVVAEVMLAPGEYAHEQAPLMVIARIDPLHVEVFVPVRHYGEIAVGSRRR